MGRVSNGHGWYRRVWRASAGASAVEFAIVAPLLILFMMTIIYFGIYISAAHSVQQLAADGARASVAGLGDPERKTLTLDYVNAAADGYYLVNVERLKVGVASGSGDSVSVTVTYDATPLLAWYPVVYDSLLNPEITRTAVVRVGGF